MSEPSSNPRSRSKVSTEVLPTPFREILLRAKKRPKKLRNNQKLKKKRKFKNQPRLPHKSSQSKTLRVRALRKFSLERNLRSNLLKRRLSARKRRPRRPKRRDLDLRMKRERELRRRTSLSSSSNKILTKLDSSQRRARRRSWFNLRMRLRSKKNSSSNRNKLRKLSSLLFRSKRSLRKKKSSKSPLRQSLKTQRELLSHKARSTLSPPNPRKRPNKKSQRRKKDLKLPTSQSQRSTVVTKPTVVNNKSKATLPSLRPSLSKTS
jgi:hypothetical protein